MMRPILFLSVAVLVGGAVQSPDISGTWVARPNEDFEFVWELRVVDGKITGTQKSPMGDAPIVDGRVAGTKIEFTIESEFFGDIQRQTVTGEIVGDELRISLVLRKKSARRELRRESRRDRLEPILVMETGENGFLHDPMAVWRLVVKRARHRQS